MIYTELTGKAMQVCFRAHRDQLDKGGMPYVFHPFHLAEQMTDENTVVTALLHDVVEDSNITLDMLKTMGFDGEIAEALRLLTRDPRISYMEYIESICANPIAKAVKIADLKHNSDLTRLPEVTSADLLRVEKYTEALKRLAEEENAG